MYLQLQSNRKATTIKTHTNNERTLIKGIYVNVMNGMNNMKHYTCISVK